MTINPDLMFCLRSLARFIYFVTDEEDRFLVQLQQTLKDYSKRTWVYNAALGLVPIDSLVADWRTRAHAESTETMNIHQALVQMYKDDPKREQNFYVVTDPERWLADPHVQRRFLNLAHQLHQDNTVVKIVIFVGSRKVIPEKLSRYIEVVHDRGLTSEEISAIVGDAAKHLQTDVPAETPKLFKGLTGYEIKMAISQSIIATKKDAKNPRRIDPGVVSDYRQKQLRKSDLVQYLDTRDFRFDDVGGAGRFKTWAKKTRATWTEKGQNFGLKPPKGVLLVGIWGCGKSLSVKALGHAWGLPVVQVEMGKLRSSGVGESEANIYRVTRLIEAAAPCIVWIDEAEKSLSGGASSAQSDAGTTSRTIGILSTWLQETDAKVCLAMTANSLKTLPVEFVNRMDERFFFDMPSEEDRIDILKIHLRKAGQDPSEFDLADLADKAQGMVGREMEQAIGAAMVESFDRGKKTLDEGVLADELTRKPRIIRTMTDEVREVLDWVGFDPEVNDGIRARFASSPDRKAGTFKLVSGDG
jgi:SpoVK/Ycf46/Vps4 family AAA+-type ATPase